MITILYLRNILNTKACIVIQADALAHPAASLAVGPKGQPGLGDQHNEGPHFNPVANLGPDRPIGLPVRVPGPPCYSFQTVSQPR